MNFRTMFPVLGILVAIAGCTAETGANNGVDTANAAQAKSTIQKDQKRAHHFAGRPHFGPDFLVFASLHEDIGLSAEQRSTIEGLVAEGRPKMERPAPDKARTAALASAIRSGKIDESSFQMDREAMKAKMEEHRAKSAASLAKLHQTLTKEQRAALVDAIAAKAAKRGEHAGERGQHREGAPALEGRGHHALGPMGGLLEGLDLTPEQEAEIEAKLAANRPAVDREAMKAKFESMKTAMSAKLQSFKNDDFDANAFVAPPEGVAKDGAKGGPAMMAKHLSAVVSVLDEAQREKLAQKIEKIETAPKARPEMRQRMRGGR